MNTGVYEILNATNGKRYIGSAVSFARRWPEHRKLLRRNKHHSIYLQHAWNKYGEAAFEFRPLLVCAPKDLVMYEQRCFDGFKPEYNRNPTAGSSLGVKRPEQTARQSGRKLSPEWCANIAIGKTGTKIGPHSLEWNAKISAAQVGRAKPPGQIEKLAAAKRGVKQSPETCAKRAGSLRGNKNAKGAVHTAEMRAAKSLRQTGKKLKPRSPEHNANNAAAQRASHARKRALASRL